jgi:tetratricopeptide (TPR) repeat protein
MSGSIQINAKIPQRVAACGLLLSVLGLGLGCSPRYVRDGGQTANPIEILELSPRIYHIKFEPIADSLETDLISTYMLGNPTSGYEETAAGGAPGEAVSVRERARVEYHKARRRFEGGAVGAAFTHISRALELDPGYEPSYLLLGDLLLAQYRVKEARDLFTKIVTRDVTNSDALVGLARCFMMTGNLENARKALIDAVIFNRVNLNAWDGLSMLGSAEDFAVHNHDAPELGIVRRMRGRHYDLVVDASLEACPSQATAWIVYASQRAVWRYEGKYKRELGLTRYRRTYEEDVDCYMALAAAWKLLSQQDTTSCESTYLDHLGGVADEGYLVPHVLFDYICLRDPLAARGFTAEAIQQMRGYVDRFVLVQEG